MDTLALATAIWADTWFRVILALLVLNIATGLAAAFYLKTFALGGMADFLLSRALPYVLVDGALQLVIRLSLGDEALGATGIDNALGALVHAFVVAALVGKVLANLRDMGIPIPRMLSDVPKPKTTASP